MLRASSLGLTSTIRRVLVPQPCHCRRRLQLRLFASWTVSQATQPIHQLQGNDVGEDANFEEVIADLPATGPSTEDVHNPFSTLLDVNREQMESPYVPWNRKFEVREQRDPPPPTQIAQNRKKRTRKVPVVTQQPSYPFGKQWGYSRTPPVHLPDGVVFRLRLLAGQVKKLRKFAKTDSSPPETEAQQSAPMGPSLRKLPEAMQNLLRTLGFASCPKRSWEAYVSLVDLIANNPVVQIYFPHIPFVYLHRLFRVICHGHPKVHQQYLQLLSIATYMRHCGGEIHVDEWNALINHSAAGVRRVQMENLTQAWSLFHDMCQGRMPASERLSFDEDDNFKAAPVQPDVVTFTTLLSIAVKAREHSAIKNILSLIDAAGLKPNRMTHLVMINYFTLTNDLGALRRTLRKMQDQELPLGLDGLNACMWAYGRANELDHVIAIYRLLRHNAEPEEDMDDEVMGELRGTLEEEYITVDPEIRPNMVTFLSVIQIMAYYGYFSPTLDIFMDLLSSDNLEPGAPMKVVDDKPIPFRYRPSPTVYRAVFIGFARHSQGPEATDDDWSLDNYQRFLELFLTLPRTTKLSQYTIYAVFSACDKVSGHNVKFMRETWKRIDDRFSISSIPHLQARLVGFKEMLFQDQESSDAG